MSVSKVLQARIAKPGKLSKNKASPVAANPTPAKTMVDAIPWPKTCICATVEFILLVTTVKLNYPAILILAKVPIYAGTTACVEPLPNQFPAFTATVPIIGPGLIATKISMNVRLVVPLFVEITRLA